jgi:hypothetical protein
MDGATSAPVLFYAASLKCKAPIANVSVIISKESAVSGETSLLSSLKKIGHFVWSLL